MDKNEVAEVEQVEQPTEAETSETTEQEEGAEPSQQEEPTADPAAEPEKKENKVQKRIDEITRARRQAEAEAEYWRKVATGDIQPPKQEPQQPQGDFIPPGYPAEPALDAFEDWDAYNRAMVRWEAGRLLAERDYQAEQTKAKTAKQTVLDGHAARMEAATAKYEDMDEVFALAPAISFNNTTWDAIIESDQSADIAYHLAKNPQEAERIVSLSPVQQIKEIARLEDKFKGASAPVKRVSQAPKPVNPVGDAGEAPAVDPDKMSDDEWLKFERERLAKLGRRY